MNAPVVDAQHLLRLVVLDRQDVRDHILPGSFSTLLADAFKTVGIHPGKAFSEAQAQSLIERAFKAAKARSYGAGAAEGAAAVLRRSVRGRHDRR